MYNSCNVLIMIELEQHCQRTDVFKRFTDSETKMTYTCTRDYIIIHIYIDVYVISYGFFFFTIYQYSILMLNIFNYCDFLQFL